MRFVTSTRLRNCFSRCVGAQTQRQKMLLWPQAFSKKADTAAGLQTLWRSRVLPLCCATGSLDIIPSTSTGK